MTELTIEQASRHAVYVQRFGGFLSNLFDPYLTRLQKELRLIMVDAPETTSSIRRINQIVAEWRKASLVVYGEYNSDVLMAQLLEFADDEAAWQVASLNKAIESTAVELTLPATAQVTASVLSNPLIFPDSADVKLLQPFIRDWEAAQIKKVGDIIRTGFITGRTNQQITQDIAGKNGYLDNQNRKSIKSMVRTSTTHTSNLARQATFDDNSDIVIGFEWVSTLDSRTSSICQNLDGRIFKNNDKNKLYPPAHPNACLKGTLITTIDGQKNIEDVVVGDLVLTHNGRYKKVTTVMAREHDGLSRDLKDSFGRCVSLTNEHPILTKTQGWINTGDVKQGFNLFYNTEKLTNPEHSGSSFVEQAILIDSHNIVSEVADELISYGIFSNTRGMSSSVKLDGGISNDEISNVSTKRNLSAKLNAKLIEYGCENALMKCKVVTERFSYGFSGLFSGLNATRRVINLHSFTRCLAALFEPFRVLFTPMIFSGGLRSKLNVSPDRVTFISSLDAKRNASLSDGVVGKPVLPLDEPKTFTFCNMFGLYDSFDKFICSSFHSKPASDKWLNVSVTSIVEYHYKGWVYNLSVQDDETYVANGFLVHNCRSSTAPILDERFNLDDGPGKRASKGIEKGQRVDADLTYYDWLKGQGNQGPKGRAFVMDVLGKERGELFMDGGLTVNKFKQLTIDELFQPIPLKELRQKQSLTLAFDKIDG